MSKFENLLKKFEQQNTANNNRFEKKFDLNIPSTGYKPQRPWRKTNEKTDPKIVLRTIQTFEKKVQELRKDRLVENNHVKRKSSWGKVGVKRGSGRGRGRGSGRGTIRGRGRGTRTRGTATTIRGRGTRTGTGTGTIRGRGTVIGSGNRKNKWGKVGVDNRSKYIPKNPQTKTNNLALPLKPKHKPKDHEIKKFSQTKQKHLENSKTFNQQNNEQEQDQDQKSLQKNDLNNKSNNNNHNTFFKSTSKDHLDSDKKNKETKKHEQSTESNVKRNFKKKDNLNNNQIKKQKLSNNLSSKLETENKNLGYNIEQKEIENKENENENEKIHKNIFKTKEGKKKEIELRTQENKTKIKILEKNENPNKGKEIKSEENNESKISKIIKKNINMNEGFKKENISLDQSLENKIHLEENTKTEIKKQNKVKETEETNKKNDNIALNKNENQEKENQKNKRQDKENKNTKENLNSKDNNKTKENKNEEKKDKNQNQKEFVKENNMKTGKESANKKDLEENNQRENGMGMYEIINGNETNNKQFDFILNEISKNNNSVNNGDDQTQKEAIKGVDKNKEEPKFEEIYKDLKSYSSFDFNSQFLPETEDFGDQNIDDFINEMDKVLEKQTIIDPKSDQSNEVEKIFGNLQDNPNITENDISEIEKWILDTGNQIKQQEYNNNGMNNNIQEQNGKEIKKKMKGDKENHGIKGEQNENENENELRKKKQNISDYNPLSPSNLFSIDDQNNTSSSVDMGNLFSDLSSFNNKDNIILTTNLEEIEQDQGNEDIENFENLYGQINFEDNNILQAGSLEKILDEMNQIDTEWGSEELKKSTSKENKQIDQNVKNLNDSLNKNGIIINSKDEIITNNKEVKVENKVKNETNQVMNDQAKMEVKIDQKINNEKNKKINNKTNSKKVINHKNLKKENIAKPKKIKKKVTQSRFQQTTVINETRLKSSSSSSNSSDSSSLSSNENQNEFQNFEENSKKKKDPGLDILQMLDEKNPEELKDIDLIKNKKNLSQPEFDKSEIESIFDEEGNETNNEEKEKEKEIKKKNKDEIKKVKITKEKENENENEIEIEIENENENEKQREKKTEKKIENDNKEEKKKLSEEQVIELLEEIEKENIQESSSTSSESEDYDLDLKEDLQEDGWDEVDKDFQSQIIKKQHGKSKLNHSEDEWIDSSFIENEKLFGKNNGLDNDDGFQEVDMNNINIGKKQEANNNRELKLDNKQGNGNFNNNNNNNNNNDDDDDEFEEIISFGQPFEGGKGKRKKTKMKMKKKAKVNKKTKIKMTSKNTSENENISKNLNKKEHGNNQETDKWVEQSINKTINVNVNVNGNGNENENKGRRENEKNEGNEFNEINQNENLKQHKIEMEKVLFNIQFLESEKILIKQTNTEPLFFEENSLLKDEQNKFILEKPQLNEENNMVNEDSIQIQNVENVQNEFVSEKSQSNEENEVNNEETWEETQKYNLVDKLIDLFKLIFGEQEINKFINTEEKKDNVYAISQWTLNLLQHLGVEIKLEIEDLIKGDNQLFEQIFTQLYIAQPELVLRLETSQNNETIQEQGQEEEGQYYEQLQGNEKKRWQEQEQEQKSNDNSNKSNSVLNINQDYYYNENYNDYQTDFNDPDQLENYEKNFHDRSEEIEELINKVEISRNDLTEIYEENTFVQDELDRIGIWVLNYIEEIIGNIFPIDNFERIKKQYLIDHDLDYLLNFIFSWARNKIQSEFSNSKQLAKKYEIIKLEYKKNLEILANEFLTVEEHKESTVQKINQENLILVERIEQLYQEFQKYDKKRESIPPVGINIFNNMSVDNLESIKNELILVLDKTDQYQLEIQTIRNNRLDIQNDIIIKIENEKEIQKQIENKKQENIKILSNYIEEATDMLINVSEDVKQLSILQQLHQDNNKLKYTINQLVNELKKIEYEKRIRLKQKFQQQQQTNTLDVSEELIIKYKQLRQRIQKLEMEKKQLLLHQQKFQNNYDEKKEMNGLKESKQNLEFTLNAINNVIGKVLPLAGTLEQRLDQEAEIELYIEYLQNEEERKTKGGIKESEIEKKEEEESENISGIDLLEFLKEDDLIIKQNRNQINEPQSTVIKDYNNQINHKGIVFFETKKNFRKKWKKMFAVLNNNLLLIYKDENKLTKPKMTIKLKKYRLMRWKTESNKFCFKLVSSDKDIIIGLTNQFQLNTWIKMLKLSLILLKSFKK
ncbi:chascon isoform d-related [Anaeramoeba flamelloides]|uniref:Chascon isoform d-related n=1 Tax=Anaeramoeba flamelloides TaxID=1746091 RepID=A0AAV8A9K2_9EUKA|nr:chascon isoform d-related [Anaeramoeba flamelloides]